MEPMTDVAPEPELPRGIALAWGVAANPQRGPKRELSIERIVDAAMAIADDGGLATVSMANVASSLGFTPMSLYRYVSAKDDLVLLMGEAGFGVPPETLGEADGWRAGLRAWSQAQVEVYRRHPWLLDIPIGGGLPSTPNNIAWLDAGLARLAPTPLTPSEKVAVALLVLSHSRWQATIERSYIEAARAAGVSPDDLDTEAQSLLERLVAPEAFPEVHAAIVAGAFGPEGGDPFVFGLDRILDGIQHYLDTRPADAVVPLPVAPDDPPEVEHDPKVREAGKAVREAEKLLRDARKREREARKIARSRVR